MIRIIDTSGPGLPCDRFRTVEDAVHHLEAASYPRRFAGVEHGQHEGAEVEFWIYDGEEVAAKVLWRVEYGAAIKDLYWRHVVTSFGPFESSDESTTDSADGADLENENA